VDGRFCGVCGGRQPETAGPVARPDVGAAATELHHRVDGRIEAGAIVRCGEDDVFVGTVDGRTAFVLVGERRVVPEACQGSFLSRSPRVHRFSVEVGAPSDGRGGAIELTLRGQLVLQIVDALTFIESGVPRAIEPLTEVVAELIAPELLTRLNRMLKLGELELAEVAGGLGDDQLRMVLGDVVGALALPATHGVIAGFDEVTLEPLAAPRSRAGEDTDVLPPASLLLAREHEGRLVELIEGPIARGTGVVVGEKDRFVGIDGARVAVTLGPGRHTLEGDLSRALLISGSAAGGSFAANLGLLSDVTGTRGPARTSGRFTITIVDPAALFGALGAQATELTSRTADKIVSIVDDEVRGALGSGAARLESIDSLIPALKARAQSMATDGTRLVIDALSIDGTFEGPTRVAENVAPADAANADLVGAQVMVAWSDGHHYPGVVEELAQGQCFVQFPNGRREWVPLAHVSRA
jgi:hypothetical protein